MCAKFKAEVYTSGPIESGPWIKDLESFFPRFRLLPGDQRGACKPVKSLTGCVLKQPPKVSKVSCIVKVSVVTWIEEKTDLILLAIDRL